jgi:ribosomal protein S27AE
MDDEMKKKISIGVAIGCIAIAAVITISTYRSSGTAGPNPDAAVTLLCTNPQCNNIFELKQSDVAPKENGDDVGTGGIRTFKCPKCNQMSGQIAIKCSKCGNVFLPNYKDMTTYDKCPKCGYSAYEQSNKK